MYLRDASFTRRNSYHVVRDRSTRTAEEGRKITFCMRIAESQETSIHSPLSWRGRFPCARTRGWSLDFLVKPATEWASTNGGEGMALEVWIIHEDISLHIPVLHTALPLPLPLSLSSHIPLSFLLPRIFTATTIHSTRHRFLFALTFASNTSRLQYFKLLTIISHFSRLYSNDESVCLWHYLLDLLILFKKKSQFIIYTCIL